MFFLILSFACLSHTHIIVVPHPVLNAPPHTHTHLHSLIFFVAHCPDVLFMVNSHKVLIWGSLATCVSRRDEEMRGWRPTRCTYSQTSEQYVTQLPDDLNHSTLQDSYCASSSWGQVQHESNISFSYKIVFVLNHIIPIKRFMTKSVTGIGCLGHVILATFFVFEKYFAKPCSSVQTYNFDFIRCFCPAFN